MSADPTASLLPIPASVLSLLPQMAGQLPVMAPKAPSIPKNVRLPPEGRHHLRRKVALKTWLMTTSGSARGYALDISETGARLSGMGTRFPVGARVLVKLQLETHAAPVVARAEVVRYRARAGGPPQQMGVRFLDLNIDEWFRLARFVDGVS